ncbi:hypothetical protein B0H11DRAFT_2211012 [Mycena galericulata]|nr:hypothetical protein B0H11DRAFT_2211012 [Mycena galericulata]
MPMREVAEGVLPEKERENWGRQEGICQMGFQRFWVPIKIIIVFFRINQGPIRVQIYVKPLLYPEPKGERETSGISGCGRKSGASGRRPEALLSAVLATPQLGRGCGVIRRMLEATGGKLVEADRLRWSPTQCNRLCGSSTRPGWDPSDRKRSGRRAWEPGLICDSAGDSEDARKGAGEAPDEVEGIRPERASAGNRTTGVKNNKDKQDPEVSRRHRDEDGNRVQNVIYWDYIDKSFIVIPEVDESEDFGTGHRDNRGKRPEGRRPDRFGAEPEAQPLKQAERVGDANRRPTDPLRERAGGPAAGAGPEAWEQVLARPASMRMCPEETRRNAEVERTVRTMRK